MNYDLIPTEVLETILSMLPSKDILTASTVCRHWYRVSSSPHVWKRFRILFLPDNVKNCEISGDVLPVHVQTEQHSSNEKSLNANSIQTSLQNFQTRFSCIKTLDASMLVHLIQPTLAIHYLKSFIHSLPNLCSLNLSNISALNDDMTRQILCKTPNLTEFIADGQTNLTDKTIATIVFLASQNRSSLNHLSINKAKITDFGLFLLAESAQYFPTLQSFHISRCIFVTDEGWGTLVSSFPCFNSLKFVDVSGNYNISFEMLSAVVETKKIIQLDVRDCEQLTIQQVETLQAKGNLSLVSNAKLLNYDYDGIRSYLEQILGIEIGA